MGDRWFDRLTTNGRKEAHCGRMMEGLLRCVWDGVILEALDSCFRRNDGGDCCDILGMVAG